MKIKINYLNKMESCIDRQIYKSLSDTYIVILGAKWPVQIPYVRPLNNILTTKGCPQFQKIVVAKSGSLLQDVLDLTKAFDVILNNKVVFNDLSF